VEGTALREQAESSETEAAMIASKMSSDESAETNDERLVRLRRPFTWMVANAAAVSALLVAGGGALKILENGLPEKKQVPSIRSSDRLHKLVERMSSPDWNLPVDLRGTVVLYPAALSDPKIWATRDSDPMSAVDKIAAALKIDPERAHRPETVLFEIVRARITPAKRRKYEAELGSIVDRVRRTEDRPPPVYDLDDRQTEPISSADVVSMLDKRRYEVDESTFKSEKEKGLASMMMSILECQHPSGWPPGYRATACPDVERYHILPGDLPKLPRKVLDEP
jgi:hypothetical protein